MREAVLPLNIYEEKNLKHLSREIDTLLNPSAYEGLYAFHKYWGKKPVEPLRFLVNVLTKKGGIVSDPFLGAGALARETCLLDRKFIGSDLNPFAVKLASFMANPCKRDLYQEEIRKIEKRVRSEIDDSYGSNSETTVSHILWANGEMKKVWERPFGKRKRIERDPTDKDAALYKLFDDYKDIGTRPINLFDNSRINAKASLTWGDLFTGRAMRNIKLLRSAIDDAHKDVKEGLELTLTASIGQMSRMVFAISSRGKTTGQTSGKVEVGSWVIGYWRPDTHFEINVWNCFESKAIKLAKGLHDENCSVAINPDIRCIDAISFLEKIPDESIDLIITDPPHGDRIPYLELSELWNATLNLDVNLSNEIIVSNAKTRKKTIREYDEKMTEFFSEAEKKLSNGGSIALFFNSRKDEEWEFVRNVCRLADVEFTGTFPMHYSASSVVQDNRAGGMKNDHILIFTKGMLNLESLNKLRAVPGWKEASPMKGEKF